MKSTLKHTAFSLSLLFVFLFGAAADRAAAQTGLTKSQAVARVRAILDRCAAACQLKINNIKAQPVKDGWRLTAQIVMNASVTVSKETASRIATRRNGAAAQNQLTAEIEAGCS